MGLSGDTVVLHTPVRPSQVPCRSVTPGLDQRCRSVTPGVDHRRAGSVTPTTARAGAITPIPCRGAGTPVSSNCYGVKTRVMRFTSSPRPTFFHWSSNAAISLAPEGSEHLFEGKIEILDRSCWKSVHSALEALNSGALVAEAGYCIVFSESRKWYFLLRREDKELEAITMLPPELFCSAATSGNPTPSPWNGHATSGNPASGNPTQLVVDFVRDSGIPTTRARTSSVEWENAKSPAAGVAVLERQAAMATPQSISISTKPPVLPLPLRCPKVDDSMRTPTATGEYARTRVRENPNAQKTWSIDRCGCIGAEGCALEHFLDADADLLFLSKSRWFSVTMVVIALNSGALMADGGFCVVFSKARRSYNLIWRADKDAELSKLFPTLACAQQAGISPQVFASPEACQISYDVKGQISTPSASPQGAHISPCFVTSVPPSQLPPSARARISSEDVENAKMQMPLARVDHGLGIQRPPRVTLPSPCSVAAALEEPVEQVAVCGAMSALAQGLWPDDGVGSPSQPSSASPAAPMQLEVTTACCEMPGAKEACHATQTQDCAAGCQAPGAEAEAFHATVEEYVSALSTALRPAEPMQTQKCSSKSPPEQGIPKLELHSANGFDFTQPSIKAQLLPMLDLALESTVEELAQQGGLNVGVWVVKDASSQPARQLVMKLVEAERQEGERFAQLFRARPALMLDHAITFPLKIVHCIGKDAVKQYDLVVMPKASGSNLSIIIGNMWYSQQAGGVDKAPALMQLIEKVGNQLAEFHQRHEGNQHGDFQPSNILYDETEDCMKFIDLSGFGPEGTCLDNDVEHFLTSLRLLSQAYGPTFFEDAQKHFQAGYETVD